VYLVYSEIYVFGLPLRPQFVEGAAQGAQTVEIVDRRLAMATSESNDRRRDHHPSCRDARQVIGFAARHPEPFGDLVAMLRISIFLCCIDRKLLPAYPYTQQMTCS